MKGVSGLGRFAKQLGKGISKAMASSSGPSDDPSGGGVGSRRVMGDKGKIRTLLPTLDGCFIVAFKDGMIEKYTEFGRLLWSVDLSTRISSLSLVAGGSVAWVGCADGTVRVLNFSDLGSTENGGGGGGVGVAQSWQAHLFPVISIAQVGTKVFTLANDGSVRGWSLNLPSQAEIDAWHLAQSSALQPHKVRVLAGSWNVGEKKPARESLVQWLGKRASEVNADIVCVGLQEMEMGTGSVAMDAAKIVLRPDMLEKGNANAQWWMSEIEAAIQSSCQCTFDRIGLRQMSGILVVAFCRTQLSRHVGELASASVACGVLGVGGNKGAAAINFTVYRRRFVFLCSHFAAHQDKVEERNNDYSKIVKNLKFKNSSTTKSASSSNNDRSIHNTVDGEGGSSLASDRWMNDGAAGSQVEAGPGLRDAEVVIWMGDFNYRISPVTYDEAVTAARQGRPFLFLCLSSLPVSLTPFPSFSWTDSFTTLLPGRARELLLPKDQLRNEAEKGNVFHGGFIFHTFFTPYSFLTTPPSPSC